MSEENELSTLRAESARLAGLQRDLLTAAACANADIEALTSLIGEDEGEDAQLHILIGWSRDVVQAAYAAETAICDRRSAIYERVRQIEHRQRVEAVVVRHAANMKGLLAALEAAKI
jgi:hypothetical protein